MMDCHNICDMKHIVSIISAVAFFFFMLPLTASAGNDSAPDRIVLRLMGDSTMADKDLSKQNPERGWGQRLPSHLDSCVTVVNYAQNGRSTKSFVDRGLWDKVKSDLKAGEYLFIQFGHNDSKADDSTRYAPAFGLYQDNLRMFVSHALSVGARPVLFTPVSRRWFDSEGNLKRDCHGDYPEAARQVAEEFGIPFVDANSITQEWLMSVGDEASRSYYMWIPEGVNPRHPDGLVDNTHTNAAGARKLVELLLPAITEAVPALAAVLPAFSTDLFGLPHAGVNYGFLALGQSAGSLAFPLLARGLGLEAGRHWLAVGAALAGLGCIWFVKPTQPNTP